MKTKSRALRGENQIHIPWMLGFCVFLAIALFFLWEEHQAHILGALPYALLLLCPILHLLMHRGRHGGDSGHASHGQHPQQEGPL